MREREKRNVGNGEFRTLYTRWAKSAISEVKVIKLCLAREMVFSLLYEWVYFFIYTAFSFSLFTFFHQFLGHENCVFNKSCYRRLNFYIREQTIKNATETDSFIMLKNHVISICTAWSGNTKNYHLSLGIFLIVAFLTSEILQQM